MSGFDRFLLKSLRICSGDLSFPGLISDFSTSSFVSMDLIATFLNASYFESKSDLFPNAFAMAAWSTIGYGT